jgi:uncharacterized protein (TIGR03118 family)
MSLYSVLNGLISRRSTRSVKPAQRRLRLEILEQRLALAGYVQTNLAADVPGTALVHDPELIEAWGISINPNGTFWLSARATDVSTVYSGDVTRPDGTISPFVKSILTVTIPEGGPTGQVFNGSSDFVVSSGAQSAPARFIFASDTGHITGWAASVPSPPAPSRTAHLMASTPGAVYTGLAIGNNGEGNFLYAADFHQGQIDVFDGTYTATTLEGDFVDPGIPEGYEPFNIQNLSGKLYVTYARPQHEDPALPRGGGGYVSVFDTNGNFLNRLVSQDHLMAPWGVALAPADFGEFSGAVIVGNHRTGHLNAFDATSGEHLGRLRDAEGDVLQIDGLFGLHFGNGTVSGDRNALYFTASPDGGAHGLFGSLRVGPEADEGLLLAAVDQLFSQDSQMASDRFDQGVDLFLPAFRGLNIAVERFRPAPPPIVPPNPIRVAPVFALNYGTPSSETLPALRGLSVALSRFHPTDPSRCLIVSPIFFGLSGTFDEPVT